MWGDLEQGRRATDWQRVVGEIVGPAILAVTIATSGLVRAEPPSTAYLFPAGGQRGTKVIARVGGHYLHDRARWEMLGAGISTSPEVIATETIWFEGPLVRLPASQRAEDYPRDYEASITIAPDAPLGERLWRVFNAQGATPARRFVVGDLPEVVEQELDGAPLPVDVTLPVTINGRVFPREDVDLWSFDAPAGRTITCAVTAATIGSPLEARIEVRDPAGRVLAEATGVGAADPVLEFATSSAGRYTVAIHDVRYDGLQPYVYRLTITDRPWIRNVYPLGGRRGHVVPLEVTGANLADSTWNLAIPAEAGESLEVRWDGPRGPSNAVVLATDEHPEVLESEPNDELAQGPTVTTPVILNGRIAKPGDRDGWTILGSQDQELVCELVAARLGSPLDAVLVVRDALGKELARADDGPNGTPDPLLRFKPPADGSYRVEVHSRYATRGGSAFAYRVRIVRPDPSLRLELTADVINVERGGQQKLAVQVVRDGGFAAPVTLTVPDLPEGVSVSEVVVPGNQNRGELVIQAAKTARIASFPIRVVGRYEDMNSARTTTAELPRRPGAPRWDQTRLAVTLPTPFRFQGAYEMTYVSCGAISRKRYTLERGGYEGPLEVRLADRQTRHLQGVTGPIITVPAGATEFVYPVSLPPWMELGRTSRVVLMATGESDDGHGGRQKVCFTSGDQNNQMVNLVSPSPLRILLDRTSLAVVPGGQAKVAIQLRRDRGLTQGIRLELMVPRHMRDVRADVVELPAGQEEGCLVLVFGPHPGPCNMPVVVRATTFRGDDPLIAEAPLELVLPN